MRHEEKIAKLSASLNREMGLFDRATSTDTREKISAIVRNLAQAIAALEGK